MGLRYEELQDISWWEYEYVSRAYRTRLARQFEPIRGLQTQLYNMFSDKKLTPVEFMRLFTDPAPAPGAAGSVAAETPEQFWERMNANNFFQSPPAAPKEK